MIGKATKYLSLIVFASIAGAYLGSAVGSALGAITGDPGWAVHGRCAGWTLFALVAAVGVPFGFVRRYPDTVKRRKTRPNQPTPPPIKRESTAPEGQRTEGGIKAILIAPLIGAFMGLILGGMLGGYGVALYFFAGLSPLGPGGWWPILPLTFQSTSDGFSTKDFVIPWLTVVGTFVISGAVLTLLGGVSCGKTRFQVFGSDKG
jgi:MFS family permease